MTNPLTETSKKTTMAIPENFSTCSRTRISFRQTICVKLNPRKPRRRPKDWKNSRCLARDRLDPQRRNDPSVKTLRITRNKLPTMNNRQTDRHAKTMKIDWRPSKINLFRAFQIAEIVERPAKIHRLCNCLEKGLRT